MVPKPSLFAAAAALSVALLCGGISILSLRAAVTALPAGPVIEKLRSGEPVSREQRVEAARATFQAGSIFESGRYYSDAALAASGLSDRDRGRALDGATVERVIDQALASAPASPHNWVRRAAYQLSAGDTKGAAVSIETSLLLGRFVPGLTVPRLRIMLDLLRRSPDSRLQSVIDEQIRMAARTEPAKLAAFADGGVAEGMTQRVLFRDIKLYGDYLDQLRARRRAEIDARKAGDTP